MADQLKSYPSHWQGQRLVLACRKCQKKLKHSGDLKPLANLRKTVKRHNKGHQNPLYLMNVSCMDLCPRNAVALCLPGLADDRLLLLRSEDGLDALYSPRPQAPALTREAPVPE